MNSPDDDERRVKTFTFTDGGFEFTLPTYMEPHKEEYLNWFWKKFLERLEAGK